jgi:hypothetical protein
LEASFPLPHNNTFIVFWNKIKKNKNKYELIELSDAASEAGTGYPSGAPAFTPGA